MPQDSTPNTHNPNIPDTLQKQNEKEIFTPESKLFTIDIHTHILPERLPNLRERYGYGGFIHLDHHKPCCARMMMDDRFFREVEDNCWSAERRMQECNHQHVDVQVLSTVPVMFGYWAKPEHTWDLSKMLNEQMSIINDYPNQWISIQYLPVSMVCNKYSNSN